MAERPDPLADPRANMPARGTRSPGMELPDACCWGNANDICPLPMAEIWWVGCTIGEHAGPAGYCADHAITMVAMGPIGISCGQCQPVRGYVAMRVLRRTDAAGAGLPLPWAAELLRGQREAAGDG